MRDARTFFLAAEYPSLLYDNVKKYDPNIPIDKGLCKGPYILKVRPELFPYLTI